MEKRQSTAAVHSGNDVLSNAAPLHVKGALTLMMDLG